MPESRTAGLLGCQPPAVRQDQDRAGGWDAEGHPEGQRGSPHPSTGPEPGTALPSVKEAVCCCCFKFFLIYLLAVFGLRFCARAFSSCGERGPLFIAVHGPITVVASLVVEHRLQTHRLSGHGSRAQLLRGMWDPPRPGHEPVSPASAGGLSTSAPPGKPPLVILFIRHHGLLYCDIMYL